MMRIAITTPEVLKGLQIHQEALLYGERTKPFSIVLSPIIDRLTGGYPVGADPERFTLIAPFTSDISRWLRLKWVNVHDGKPYRLAQPGRLPHEAEPSTYGDVVGQYGWHAEAKSLAPDGKPCASHTAGLLRRTPVVATVPFRSIGKETDRRWEREEDISLIEPLTVEYRPNETERLEPIAKPRFVSTKYFVFNKSRVVLQLLLVADPVLRRNASDVSIRSLAKAARVSDATVKALRRGKRLRKSTVHKLATALKSLPKT